MVRDYTFGTDGFAKLTPWVDGGGTGVDIGVDSKSRIIAACFTRIAGNDQLVISRFLSDGKPDTSFAPSGFVTMPSEGSSRIRIVEADPERVVIAGGRGTRAFIARYWM